MSGVSPVLVSLALTSAPSSISASSFGPGIHEADLSRVFDRFVTYRPAGNRRDHLGLLAIARTIVEGYGGSVSASNRPEGGAAFEVRLRRVTDAVTQSI
jgi:signal transduction histidine kinase